LFEDELGAIEMSAFIVDPETINRVVTWMSNEIETNRYTPLRALAQEYDINLSDEAWEPKLAIAMRQMNYDAVLDRYEGRVEVTENEFTYVPEHTDNRVQVFKSLQCWKYQCTEGDIPGSPLYHFFERVMGILASGITENSSAYDSAKWA
jgi:hypothetical protein